MSPIAEQLVGSWALNRYLEADLAESTVTMPLGACPQGMIIYTADGHMSAQIMPAGGGGYHLGYAGRFSVDEESGVVHHHVDVSITPDLCGHVQSRRVDLSRPSSLRLQTINPIITPSGRVVSTVHWVRLGER